MQPIQRLTFVRLLRPLRLRFDDEYAVTRDARIGERQQPCLDAVCQTGRVDVEAQLHCRGNFVDVLSTGTLRADGGDFNFGGGDENSEHV